MEHKQSRESPRQAAASVTNGDGNGNNIAQNVDSNAVVNSILRNSLPLDNRNGGDIRVSHSDVATKMHREIDSAMISAGVQHPLNILSTGGAEGLVQSNRTRLYTPFLTFTREEDGELYRRQMKTLPPYFPILLMTAITVNLVVLHVWFSTMFSSTQLFLVAGVFNLLIFPFSAALFVAQNALASGVSPMSPLGRFARYILVDASGGEYDSVILVFSAFGLGLLLLARVYSGECMIGDKRGMPIEYTVSSWWTTDDPTSQLPLLGCNPEATVRRPPQESVILLFAVPTFIQIAVKGCSKYAILITWCMSITFVIISAAHMENLAGNIWIILFPIIILFIQYELERYKMATFLSNKLALEIAIAKEKVEYEQKVAAALADREREAQEKEQELLRNLIGNVAHDMKTPLLSMTMGLEDLRATLQEMLAAFGYADQEAFRKVLERTTTDLGGSATPATAHIRESTLSLKMKNGALAVSDNRPRRRDTMDSSSFRTSPSSVSGSSLYTLGFANKHSSAASVMRCMSSTLSAAADDKNVGSHVSLQLAHDAIIKKESAIALRQDSVTGGLQCSSHRLPGSIRVAASTSLRCHSHTPLQGSNLADSKDINRSLSVISEPQERTRQQPPPSSSCGGEEQKEAAAELQAPSNEIERSCSVISKQHLAHTQVQLTHIHHQLLHAAAEALVNMEVSCSFMTMSINRAIDFAKASRDVALVPKIESIDITHAVEAQVHCINSLRASESAPLAVSDTSAMTKNNLSKFILTDKQWLVENILCLLSNAMKYSEDNTIVTARIEFDTFHSAPMTSSSSIHQQHLKAATKRPGTHIVEDIFATVQEFRSQFRSSVAVGGPKASSSSSGHHNHAAASAAAAGRGLNRMSSVHTDHYHRTTRLGMNRHSVALSEIMQARDAASSHHNGHGDQHIVFGVPARQLSAPMTPGGSNHPQQQQQEEVSKKDRGSTASITATVHKKEEQRGRPAIDNSRTSLHHPSHLGDETALSSPVGVGVASILRAPSAKWSSIPVISGNSGQQQQQQQPKKRFSVCDEGVSTTYKRGVGSRTGSRRVFPIVPAVNGPLSPPAAETGKKSEGKENRRSEEIASSSSYSLEEESAAAAPLLIPSAAAGAGAGGAGRFPATGAENSKGVMWTDMLRITVEDTGPGLSEEAMEKLFHNQAAKQGQRFTGGTGLGLFSLAKRMEALGGRCGVRTRDDGKPGCVFWFAIPYRPDNSFESRDGPHCSKHGDSVRMFLEAEAPPTWDLSRRLLAMPSQLDQVAVRNGEGSLVPAGVPCTNSTRNDGVVTSARQTTSAQGPIVVADTTGTMTGLDVALPSFVLSTVLESAATSTAHTPAPTATRGAATRSSVAWLAALTSEEIDDEMQQPPSASSGTGTAGAGGTTGTAGTATQTGSEKATENDRRSSSSSSSKLRVLVVDDAQTVLRLVSRTLEKQGFIVDTAKNGAVALEKMIQANTMNGNSLSEKSYDVVLTDIQMPVMNGIEATKQYRQREKKREEEQEEKQYRQREKKREEEQEEKQQRQREKEREEQQQEKQQRQREKDRQPVAQVAAPPVDSSPSDAVAAALGGVGQAAISVKAPEDLGESRTSTSAARSPRQALPVKKGRLLIIGMSANSDSETKRLAKEAGMDHFLEKPFAVADFVKLVKES